MFKVGLARPSPVTVWGALSRLVQTTVSPFLMVSADGLKANPWMEAERVAGAGGGTGVGAAGGGFCGEGWGVGVGFGAVEAGGGDPEPVEGDLGDAGAGAVGVACGELAGSVEGGGVGGVMVCDSGLAWGFKGDAVSLLLTK